VTLLDLFMLAFHLSGLIVLAALYLRFRDRLRATPWLPAEKGGDDGGSDRLPITPILPWSWHSRPRLGGGGRSGVVRRRRSPAGGGR
jgi:hypothetical protein